MNSFWKLLLLNQFHDVIPGTSIGAVYVDAHAHHREIAERGAALIEQALTAFRTSTEPEHWFAFNTLSWERRAVILLPPGVPGDQLVQSSHANDEIGRALGHS